MSPVTEARVVALRGQHPGWGPTRIRYQLGKEDVDPLPGRSSVYRALVRHGLIDPVSFAGTMYRAGRAWAGRSLQVAIIAGSVQLSAGSTVVRVHPIRHDRAKEHVAFATPTGDPANRPPPTPPTTPLMPRPAPANTMTQL